jgi:transposase
LGHHRRSSRPANCGVDPYAYLADVITKIISGHPNSRIDHLLPWAYLAEPELKAVA